MLPWAIVASKVAFPLSLSLSWTYYAIIFGGANIFSFVVVSVVHFIWLCRVLGERSRQTQHTVPSWQIMDKTYSIYSGNEWDTRKETVSHLHSGHKTTGRTQPGSWFSGVTHEASWRNNPLGRMICEFRKTARLRRFLIRNVTTKTNEACRWGRVINWRRVMNWECGRLWEVAN